MDAAQTLTGERRAMGIGIRQADHNQNQQDNNTRVRLWEDRS